MPRKVFTAGEVLAAADVNEFLMDQTVMTFAGTAARGSAIGTAVEGMVTYLEDSNSLELYDGSVWRPAVNTESILDTSVTAAKLAAGTILQIQRGVDTVDATSTSSSFANTGLSVTITPIRASSNILLLCTFASSISGSGTNNQYQVRIVQGASTVVQGAQNIRMGIDGATFSTLFGPTTIGAFVAAGSTSARTFTLQLARIVGGTATIRNTESTSQIFAIEIGA
jgi:hypothetical protein